MECWGKSASIDVRNCLPELIRSEEIVRDFAIKLCDLIEMKRFGDPQIVHFGTENKEGLTLVQLIETSNITAHFSNDTNSAYIDVFSCKDFNEEMVAEFSLNHFGGDEVTVQVAMRK